MATYAIGDLQGCLAPLQRLLAAISFNPAADTLWLAGDLINRGPDSLGTLRYVAAMGARVKVVLGNHDLHLLARAAGGRAGRRDTLDELLAAADAPQLLNWLRHRPLLVVGSGELQGYAMSHAGLPPQWSLQTAIKMAAQVEAALRGPEHVKFLQEMYGDEPRMWTPALRGRRRLRYAVNAFTRMRYVCADGSLEFRHKGAPAVTKGLVPWFAAENRQNRELKLLFGHWSTLGQVHWPEHNVWGLDTGAVWGNKLTALNLNTQVITQVSCPENAKGELDAEHD